ncbi:DUF2637 domain-containing protein [Streptomyces cocklensis]|uniref:DUF2637 domain-containing protein n=1 Tax=Actinacidiphila cocklensis TaxID=887465 RepID=A0A9W4DN43_9ACTN|nr:DUF2637 domain-containing protein [Actinacidiphila cocklensis]MDD1058106.1 DUF2637 domain-containing protein [Actinacidiphila cocklensis]CAG6393142.1 conserved membrane hypothetical protein [Actinacidiphila cocklensis]
MSSKAETAAPRDAWVMAGMATAAASAAVASFTGLRGLALDTGWPPRLAWLLPVTIDAYAMTSARVWLAGTTRAPHARRFARANAIGAITASIAGNATYHAAAVGLIAISWPIVVLVGAVPAAVLGLTAHLHAVRSPDEHDDMAVRTSTADQAGPRDRPAVRRRTASRRPKTRSEDELWQAAQDADARHRAEHDGRPITRDALRTTLRIAGPRATDFRRRLAEAPTPDPDRKEAEPTP